MSNDFFHTNLRAARDRAGLSQEELAEELGLARSTVGSLENGRTRLFNKNIPRIAGLLNLTVEELLCGERAEVLLKEEQLLDERERALVAEYESRIAALEARLDTANRLNDALQANVKTLQDNVDSLTRSNQYMLEQLGKTR